MEHIGHWFQFAAALLSCRLTRLQEKVVLLWLQLPATGHLQQKGSHCCSQLLASNVYTLKFFFIQALSPASLVVKENAAAFPPQRTSLRVVDSNGVYFETRDLRVKTHTQKQNFRDLNQYLDFFLCHLSGYFDFNSTFLTNANSSETGRELHPKGGRVQANSLNSFKSLPRLNVHSQVKQSMLSLKSNSPAAFNFSIAWNVW